MDCEYDAERGSEPEAKREHAHAEFEKYEAERRRIEATTPTSDFDRFVEQTKQMIKNEESLPKIGEPAQRNRERKE